ncbi:site-2 protease family protein [Saccharibacillus sp. JS10]|uniref:site-2 protease family protein n=1 Tax=Saccharibacillus sp. JS10 TaxID=2950552 RepID=UPI00210D08B7|nr:site-2 protease family protein [Saccharibacillus sp. JS10]MCQ4087443.1 hypothetical protein [Saccharibacillus sp. JS10]
MKKNILIFVGVAAAAGGLAFLLLPGNNGEGLWARIQWLSTLHIIWQAVLAFALAILLHEGGHLLGALGTRTKVTRLCWGPFIVYFAPLSLKWGGWNPFFFGAIHSEIAPYRDEESFSAAIRAQRIVFAAGPIISLIAGLAVLRQAEGILEFAGLFGLASIAIGIGTLLTDGTSAMLLGSRNYALYFAWNALVSANELDMNKRNWLLADSKRHIQQFAGQSVQPGKELYDLNVLYYVLAMQDVPSKPDLAIQSIIDKRLKFGADAFPTKIYRDTLAMILTEQVLSLHSSGQTEEAASLSEQLKQQWELDDLSSLKLEAFIQSSAPRADDYLNRIRAMRTTFHSYGALLEFERSRLQR